jgi:hypothetical protein
VKHLKSKSSDLRRLFERAICVREIAEPLVSFDADRDAAATEAFMDSRNFDVVGVRENGQVVGYVRRNNLKPGRIRDCLVRFGNGENPITESDPLVSAIQALRNRSELFVTVLGHVGAIVTKGDLQKAPVRLWLFGMISLIEMRMLRLIRTHLPDGSWKDLLTQGRLEAAQKIFAERQRRNEEADVMDFSDCLQLCDKATILLRTTNLLKVAGFESRSGGQRFFAFVEALRNDLAHSNDILKGRWPELATRVVDAESLLMRLEQGE